MYPPNEYKIDPNIGPNKNPISENISAIPI